MIGMIRSKETLGLKTLGMGLMLGVSSCMAMQHTGAMNLSVEAAKAWLALQMNPVHVPVWQEGVTTGVFQLNPNERDSKLHLSAFDINVVDAVNCSRNTQTPAFQYLSLSSKPHNSIGNSLHGSALLASVTIPVAHCRVTKQYIPHSAFDYSSQVPQLNAIRAGPMV
jgi:hypothetical protein